MSSSRSRLLTAEQIAAHAATRSWSPDDLMDGDSFLGSVSFHESIEERVAREGAEADAMHRAEQQAVETRRNQELEAAWKAGFAEGHATGELAERDRLALARAAVESALDTLRAGEERWTGMIEENIAALSVAIARHVIGREVETDATVLAGLVRRAMTEFPIDQTLTIRVHPTDLAVISQSGTAGEAPAPVAQTLDGAVGSSGLAAAVGAGRDLRWVADARVTRGGCLIEGRERIIDGRVDTAVERIYRQLTRAHA
jgi:flagellar biosynthesis/type III secretory pathway protein FliH